jgi:RNA polymerase-binding transcription factor DksA
MLTDAQRARIEERLVEERERALEAIGDFDETYSSSLLERTGETSVYRFHMADLGSEMLEQEQQHLLASQEGERLYRIDDALRRLYNEPERFGRCANCGRDIGFERLEMVPEGALCIDCQRQAEE